MNPVSFEKYKPDPDNGGWPPAKIVFLLWVGLVLFSVISLPGDSGLAKYFLLTYAGCVIAVSFYFGFRSRFTYQPLDGVMNGEITFYEDKIVVNELLFPLTDISNMDFSISDYFEKANPWKGFNPRLSQGGENYVSFDDKSGQKKIAYFKLMDKHSSSTLHPFIDAAVKVGAMSYIRAIDIFGIENVTKP